MKSIEEDNAGALTTSCPPDSVGGRYAGASRPLQTPISTSTNSNIRSSPGRLPSLPSSGGFRLQPRRHIPALARPSPSRNVPREINWASSTSSRGRKRGAQTLASTQSGSSFMIPRVLFTSDCDSTGLSTGSNNPSTECT